MNELFLRSWKGLAVRGAVALVFGILAVLWPGLTLMWLIAMFAAYALIGGTVSIINALQNREGNSDWWLLLLLGMVGIAAGVLAIIGPALTAIMLVLIIGATAFGTGILDIAMGIRLRKVIHGEALLILNGIVSVMFGVAIFFFPGAGALALVWLISAYAVISGVLLLALAWRARNWENSGGAQDALPSGDLSHGSS
ncbi:MAG: HdeD family acid-resistance protein [Pseudomonadota bacterium]|nr:HdeD family acid-resistance protein [Pseudomonadota bacterium]